MRPLRLALLCALAICCFAGNSLLTRGALGSGQAGPAGFTALRLLSGAVVLLLIAGRRLKNSTGAGWPSALALFLYAAPFSFAYLQLRAGTGALILFAAVQATMLIVGIAQGERPPLRTFLGLGLALCGLVILLLPGVTAPQPVAAALMIAAGIAWGAYSLRGRKTKDSRAATAEAFLICAPFSVLLWLLAPKEAPLSTRGAALAIASGAIASGLGYSLWNAALPHLGASSAAVLQLAAPALAAVFGILLLGESFTLRLAAGGVAILGGIALAVRFKAR